MAAPQAACRGLSARPSSGPWTGLRGKLAWFRTSRVGRSELPTLPLVCSCTRLRFEEGKGHRDHGYYRNTRHGGIIRFTTCRLETSKIIIKSHRLSWPWKWRRTEGALPPWPPRQPISLLTGKGLVAEMAQSEVPRRPTFMGDLPSGRGDTFMMQEGTPGQESGALVAIHPRPVAPSKAANLSPSVSSAMRCEACLCLCQKTILSEKKQKQTKTGTQNMTIQKGI